MMIRKIFPLIILVLLASCSTDNTPVGPEEQPDINNPGDSGNVADDSDMPDFDTKIYPYQGQLASDQNLADVVGNDKDLFWELNSFNHTVDIVYDGESVTCSSSNDNIIIIENGAHVVVDFLTKGISGVKINLSGRSNNGSLKIYGDKKFLLNLNGLELTSKTGPAINNQCKSRMFVNLKEGTTNRLTDSKTYSDDPYYLSGKTPADEDRKGTFFSESNLIFSGSGSLVVAGKQKHGIASDGYMYVRPGVTIAVTEAAKNAIHIKGDKSEEIGIMITGGLIYTFTESEAGKGLKTDYNVEIRGGHLDLNTKGDAIYETDENDTSSAAGIKADGNIIIAGGDISVKSSGSGGKGFNSDSDLIVSGGNITIVTTGKKYIYNATQNLESSPKGIKIGGDITIKDGILNVMVTGVSDGSEGIESKSVLTVERGDVYVYAYGDAMKAAGGINFNNGKVYAYSLNNDGIDSKGYLNINGGIVISCGSQVEESFDCETESRFLINGGTAIGIGGNYNNTASNKSSQRMVYLNGFSLSKNKNLCILDSQSKPLFTYNTPRTLNDMVLFISSPDFRFGETYTLSTEGDISDYAENWFGYYKGGIWKDGSTIVTFSPEKIITELSN